MKIIDVTDDMESFVFPGNPDCKPEGPHNRVEGANREFVYDVRLCTQSGTHIQGPHYFLQDGATIDSFPLTRFCGVAHVVDIEKRGSDTTADELRKLISPEKLQGNILVLRTGHMDELVVSKKLVAAERPGLSLDAATYLADSGVSMIAIDSVGVESRETENYEVNVFLCQRGVLLLEGLVNLNQVTKTKVRLQAFPLKLKGVEGTPCRAVIFED